MKGWIINPEADTVDLLTTYGRFLEDDYRMAIDSLQIPDTFEEYIEKSNRRFLIIGSKEAPGLIAKSVYLCLKLAGPDSVAVKTNMIDESIMVQNVFKNHAGDVETKLFVTNSDELLLDSVWRDTIEEATDIIVFGNENSMETFRDYEQVGRRVWEHGSKFSFGIVRAEHLTPLLINSICFDFFSYYGEGFLAPKFYFIVGNLRKKVAQQFSHNMQAFYGEFIEQYRNKLPFTRQSDLVQEVINANYIGKYLRLEDLNSDAIFDTLYGDIRLVLVDDLDEVSDFIDKWNDNISTVAINLDDDLDSLDLLEDKQVMRICPVGDMQFPDFFEQYNTVDDFNIYDNSDDDTDF